MSAFLEKEGCATVGSENPESMCTVTIDRARILLGAHIDNFVITCANRQVLDAFRARFWTHLKAPMRRLYNITL